MCTLESDLLATEHFRLSRALDDIRGSVEGLPLPLLLNLWSPHPHGRVEMVSREYLCLPRSVCERETVLASSLPASRDEDAFVHSLFTLGISFTTLVNNSGLPNLHTGPLTIRLITLACRLLPLCKARHLDGPASALHHPYTHHPVWHPLNRASHWRDLPTSVLRM